MKPSVASFAAVDVLGHAKPGKERGLIELDPRFREPLLETLAAEVDACVDDTWRREPKLFETSELHADAERSSHRLGQGSACPIVQVPRAAGPDREFR
jgi:hypothetical protein